MRRVCLALGLLALAPQDAVVEVRSAKSGAWSDPKTWEQGRLPAAGTRVRIRPGHRVVYDVASDAVLRSVLIGGTLRFDPDRETRLNAGLINIQPGESAGETGFDCADHPPAAAAGDPPAALEVGSAEQPIAVGKTATIRLHLIEGMDKGSFPAIVCCGGGRMELHGAPLSRTWLKLGKPAAAGDREVALEEAVSGWKAGDRVIVTSTMRQSKAKKTFKESTRDGTQTEERIVESVDGATLKLDRPLDFSHIADRQYRGEVANLSRNIVVESADPAVARGHTMYHRDAAGSIGYAEFRHLGKEGVLGRYSLHFHRVGDTMRGASVIGASIWDSGNRWITIHGTNYLVVRDCVGYRSVGHGFFMEDGSEVYNVLDRNLAVQAFLAKPLPKQLLPYDKNDGSGFWWANCRNAFTRNVACDCDEYGYFFQSTKTADFDPTLSIAQPDWTRKDVDIRTLPFVRFEDNEVHSNFGLYGFNLGEGVNRVGPDTKHPFIVRNLKIWDTHYGFRPQVPNL
ncbi:MAG: G8 domain-containing protein, partial [Planctomycetes bacterium]|nr:G8 domain-containing protein [Planctomycetota bacterium]